MKQVFVTICMLLCIFGTACGRKQAVQEQISQSTLGEVYPVCAYEYAYEEKKDGTVEFTVKGTWNKDARWEAESSVGEVVSISPVEEKKNQITYLLTPEIDGGGYSDVIFRLRDASGQQLYSINVLAVTDEKGKLSVDSVNYYEGGISDELLLDLTGGVEGE